MQDRDPELRLVGSWLARWRREVGVSQRTLAARAGVNQAGISRVERGLQGCGSRRLARLIITLDGLGRENIMGPIQPPPVRGRAGYGPATSLSEEEHAYRGGAC
jgi:transcriptional regulator with XRE-family HTH domain